MKSLSAKLAMAAAAAGLILACTKTDLEPAGGGGEDGDQVAVVVHAGIGSEASTRAHDAVWEENDAIGLAMLEDNGHQIVNDVYNYHYETREHRGVFTPASSDMMVYFPADGRDVSFRAYYPYYSALGTDMLIPVDVSNQNILPDVDLMSAELASGYSKRNPTVRLSFYHRLTKLIFMFDNDNQEVFGPLEDCVVTIHGMKTTGTFHLIEEELDVNADSGKDITFPIHGDVGVDQRYGIVLPRAAGEGVSFDFKFPKGTYTARMADNLELLPGYKYIFHIDFKETPAVITAEIVDWLDGPETSYDWVQPDTSVGENENVDEGTIMDLFVSGDNAEFSPLGTFTYVNDKWTTDSPVYWESIPYDPAYMRASIEMEAPLNDTQTGDWLTSESQTVARNSGVHFTLSRAVTKTFVELRSDEFTAQQLAAATVTLPDYLTGGRLDNGEFVPGTARADILMTDDEDTGYRVALFQPQSVSAGGKVLEIEIDGRTYTVEADQGAISFDAGYASKIVVTLNKNELSVSVTVVDWKPGDIHTFETLQLGTVAGESHDVTEGDAIDLYMLEGSAYKFMSTYTYQANGTWSSGDPIYWEDLPAGTKYFIARMDGDDALNSTQLPDVLLSEPTRVYDFEPVDFQLYHAAAKAAVVLVSDTFTDAQLRAADITLPGYLTGGSFEGAALVNGSATGNIVVDRDDPEVGIALIQPQTINAGDNVVAVTIGGTTYYATKPGQDVVFQPGYATTLVVHVNKNGISLGVTVNDWDETEYKLSTVAVNAVADKTDGVDPGEKMNLYAGNTAYRELLATYTWDGTKWDDQKVYWENLDDPTTFYASILRRTAYDPATMPDDQLLADPLTVGYGSPVNLNLSHAVAQVAVQLLSSDGSFTDEQLLAMKVTLPGYATGGTYDNGVFNPGSSSGDVPLVKIDGSYMAFVQAQTITPGKDVAIVSTTDRDYPVKYDSEILYRAGYTTVLMINVKKTGVSLSARVTDWVREGEIQIVADALDIEGSLQGTDASYFDGKTIWVYDMTKSQAHPYTYTNGIWSGDKLYWESYITTGLDLAAVYYNSFNPVQTVTPTFQVTVPPDQTTGWEQYDLLMDYISAGVGEYIYFNFMFKHVLSRAKVVVRSDEFTDDQLAGATVRLLGFQMNGTASMTSSAVTATGSPTTVTPYTEVDGRQYSAIVMPQMINANTTVVSIELPGYPGETFTGSYSGNLNFVAGRITEIDLLLVRGRIQISARVEEWENNGGGTIIIE